MASDTGNDVITSDEQRPEMEVDRASKRHALRVPCWRPSLDHHLLSVLLLLLSAITSQSFELSGEYVNKQFTVPVLYSRH